MTRRGSMDVHVYIGVTNLQRGIEFYTQGLGLRLRRHLSADWVELEGASVPIFLDVVSNRPADFSGPWTVHLDFVTLIIPRCSISPEFLNLLKRGHENASRGSLANPEGPKNSCGLFFIELKQTAQA